MTAADKLRELLATRPAMPDTQQLVRWWRTADLVREVLDERDALRSEIAGGLPRTVTLVAGPRLPVGTADDESCCAVCGWPLADSKDNGCVRGDCSMRPRPASLYAPVRAEREAEDLHERALLNGMPPSGRWA